MKEKLNKYLKNIGNGVFRGVSGFADMLYSNLWMLFFYMLQLGSIATYIWSPEGALTISGEYFLRGMRSAFLPAFIFMVVRGFILLGNPARWRRIIAALLTISVILPPLMETWLSFMLHTRWSDRIIRLIADTNPSESGEFFSLYLLTPKSIGVLLGYALLSKVIYDSLRWMGHILHIRVAPKPRLVQRCGAFILIGLGFWWWNLPAENNYNAENSLNTLERIRKMMAVHQRTLKNIKALEKTPRLADGRIKEGANPPSKIIWVIGESDSKAHWSLYGYRLPTTPNMEREEEDGNLLKFEDVICFEPRTYRMMEILFSPYVVTQKSSQYLQNPLTPMILRKAGFMVRLHDNQATLVRGDDQAEVGTSNFMNSRILSNANFDYRNEEMYPYDRRLIEAVLPMILDSSDSTRNSLDIFHLNGQHFSAINRYPAGFGKFDTGDYAQRKDLNEEDKGMIAAYDNATLYVDSVLELLMSAVRDEDCIVIYHPDHGEEINDERRCHVRTMDSHKLPQSAPYVLEIPFIVYTTPKFRRLHPDLYHRLVNAKEEKQSLIYFSHFLMDVAEVESKYQHPEYSPLSPKWSRPPRVVKEIGTYDKWKEKYLNGK